MTHVLDSQELTSSMTSAGKAYIAARLLLMQLPRPSCGARLRSITAILELR